MKAIYEEYDLFCKSFIKNAPVCYIIHEKVTVPGANIPLKEKSFTNGNLNLFVCPVCEANLHGWQTLSRNSKSRHNPKSSIDE